MDTDRFRHHLAGPVASINTPFLEHDGIDYAGLRRFVDFCIDSGAGTVLFTPGDSLYSLLTEAEIAEMTEFTARVVNGRALFIASAGFWSTKQTAGFAEYARDCGADALIVAPPDRGMTVDGLVAYYGAVSQALPAFILSAGLVSVGVRGALETVERLLDEVPGVVGFKEDFGPDFARGACVRAHEKWVIFAGGQKQTHMDMLPYGCDGYMSTFIKFKPEVAHAYSSAIETKTSIGRRHHRALRHAIVVTLQVPFRPRDAAQHAVWNAGICGRWRCKPPARFTNRELRAAQGICLRRGCFSRAPGRAGRLPVTGEKRHVGLARSTYRLRHGQKIRLQLLHHWGQPASRGPGPFVPEQQGFTPSIDVLPNYTTAADRWTQ